MGKWRARKPSVGSLCARLGLAALGILGGVVASECVLRLVRFEYAVFHRPDEFLGAALIPGAKGTYSDEGRADVVINSAGFRDEERAEEKPKGTFRIALIGDSYVEALQVPRRLTVGSQLEMLLEKRRCFAGARVEVLSFGVSGYSTAQELLLLRARIRKYFPDLVVLAFVTGNDVRDNSAELAAASVRPYFRLVRGRLVLDDSFRGSLQYRLRCWTWRLARHLRLVQAFLKARRRWAAGLGGGNQWPPGPRVSERGIDAEIYSEPQSRPWREAWEVTEALLRAMRDEVRGIGARFLVVVVPSPITVHPERRVRDAYEKLLGVRDLLYPERRLRAFGAKEGIEILTLAERLQRHAEVRRVYLHGFSVGHLGSGHWNVEGHRLAAEAVAEYLCEPN